MDLTEIWGNKDNIGPLEIAARSAVMFVYMIILLRITGMRTFGKGHVFDDILTILFGAVLARGIVGATPFVSALVSGAALVAMHTLFSKLSYYWKAFERLAKGKHRLLFSEGKFQKGNLQKVNITEDDVMEELRINLQKDSLKDIKEVRLECTGEVSFVKEEEGL